MNEQMPSFLLHVVTKPNGSAHIHFSCSKVSIGPDSWDKKPENKSYCKYILVSCSNYSF